MGKYKNKIVWITGASSGIGEALVYAFAKEGSQVILSARRENELIRVKKNCKNSEQHFVLPLDLAKHDELPEKVEQVMAYFSRIDVLVNGGGISQRSKILDTDFSVYKRLMDVDYLGTVALSKSVLEVFVKQGGGQFGVITSLMGKFASPLRSGYCGAKHALHGFFDALRLEHDDDNVRVTMFCPGFIRTDISLNALIGDGSAQNKMDNAQDVGMSAEDCAKEIIRGLRKEKFEVAIGGKETIALYIKRFFPRLLHRVVKKSAVT